MATDKLDRINIEHIFDLTINDWRYLGYSILENICHQSTKTIDPTEPKWTDFKSFWPPRLLTAFRNDSFLCFFGDN